MTDPVDCGTRSASPSARTCRRRPDYRRRSSSRGSGASAARAGSGRGRGGGRRHPEAAKAPVIVSGGGVLYSGAGDLLADFAARRNIPIVETQAGKGATAHEHPMNFGSPGVTSSACGNAACAAADLVIGVGTRFRTSPPARGRCSPTLRARTLVSINVHGYDALKHGALSGSSATRRRRWKDRHRPRRRPLLGPPTRRRAPTGTPPSPGHRRPEPRREQAPLRRAGDRRRPAHRDHEDRRHIAPQGPCRARCGAVAGGAGAAITWSTATLHGLRDRRAMGIGSPRREKDVVRSVGDGST